MGGQPKSAGASAADKSAGGQAPIQQVVAFLGRGQAVFRQRQPCTYLQVVQDGVLSGPHDDLFSFIGVVVAQQV